GMLNFFELAFLGSEVFEDVQHRALGAGHARFLRGEILQNVKRRAMRDLKCVPLGPGIRWQFDRNGICASTVHGVPAVTERSVSCLLSSSTSFFSSIIFSSRPTVSF